MIHACQDGSTQGKGKAPAPMCSFTEGFHRNIVKTVVGARELEGAAIGPRGVARGSPAGSAAWTAHMLINKYYKRNVFLFSSS